MKNPSVLIRLAAAALFCLPAPVFAAVQLAPVMAIGLSNPLFVTNARDGRNRLFIVEQGGIIRVQQPSSSFATVFLDIRSRVVSGGERGLLGLAFHPLYGMNGRFFVYYTRVGDAALVIAEYGASDNPNVANTTERVLLAIPHPTNANHNGGMLAFAPDRYLYIGVGDGGSANDPPNNAQNVNALLGKLLRINVDLPDAMAGTPYSSPADNPYVGREGRDEIHSIGWRNPWRFSFDRMTGDLWVADVGQGTREEVNAPTLKGGNYGWRPYEGTACTNNSPGLCIPANYVFPAFEYLHTGGRCSITGGYVYRGRRGVLPEGTYIYGDYCTGEIFTWNGATQTLLMDTTMRISSFGEDEEGELYVVDLNGAVWKLESTDNGVSRVIEYYHPIFNHYFITGLPVEIGSLDNSSFSGWMRTGFWFNVYRPDAIYTVPVCRFFSTAFGLRSSHFYTSSAAECEIVKANPDWQFEGQVFNVLPALFGTCPDGFQYLYRLYNNGEGESPNHRYVIDPSLREWMMVAFAWIPEGDGIGVIGCLPP